MAFHGAQTVQSKNDGDKQSKVFREVGLQIRWTTVKRQDDKDLSNIVFILKETHDFLSLSL